MAKKTKAKAKGSTKKKEGKDFKSTHSHLFKKEPRLFRIGRDIPPKRDLYRFVRWPRYIRLQRQKAILKKRLKVPPAINQFTKAITGNQAKDLFRLLRHYRPESPEDKTARLKKEAEAQKKEEDKESKKLEGKAKRESDKAKKEQAKVAKAKRPLVLKYGLNHITTLVETKKAKLVAIAHDVDPIELVVWLPALCRRMGVPYVIVKGKARLGHLVHKKTASAVALTDVRKEHDNAFQNIVATSLIQYNDNVRTRTEWGGGQMGGKFLARKKKEDAARTAELAKASK